MFRVSIVLMSLTVAMALASCTHSGNVSKSKAQQNRLTDSRIPKTGSPQSRGVRVIKSRQIAEMADPSLGRSLQKATPILQNGSNR